jgi:signal transduction histidine kinase
MIDDIENYSNKIPEERTVESIHDVLCKSVNMARENAEIVEVDTSKIAVDVSNNDGSKFKISRQPFLMALTNIIKNAFESFMHAKPDVDPKITVQFKAEAGKITTEISDNGIGISPKDIQNITTFVPGRYNKSKKQSTGFGLPQAMRTIRAHNGEVSVMSQEGQGTTIRIELPSTMESEEV